ncbi:TIGR02757 family protein [Riemerella columbipharyngis]|uniref:TIGR02757 family protein n=1 Tax=Riemerella columbipharyngis TaxID=1071918 RepID=A0A1G7CEJ5_9FLAO|nr:TIGR02757 family protein [Riemerella columbipharyngis]SDE37160.1 TIGR02757 family protein [Riemerella columbipharyngis]
MTLTELKNFLDEKADQYNNVEFIADDPVQIPHSFSIRQDIEISAFFAATIAWGNRKSIIKNAKSIVSIMENSPYDFVMNYSSRDLDLGAKALHRTFNTDDFVFFIKNLRRVYCEYSSMEDLFLLDPEEQNFYHALERFRSYFVNNEVHRSVKHISSTYKNSAAKRLMMFLRWMVRRDSRGVDFGLWDRISPAYLSIPLDVHTGNIARKLKLVTRKQNDWKTVEELDKKIRKMNPKDPALYDYALFGLGVSEGF